MRPIHSRFQIKSATHYVQLIQSSQSINYGRNGNDYAGYRDGLIRDGSRPPRLFEFVKHHLPFLICTLSVVGLLFGFFLVISAMMFCNYRLLPVGIIIVFLCAIVLYYVIGQENPGILGDKLPVLRTVRSANRAKAKRLRFSQWIPIKVPESIGNGDFHSRPSTDIGILYRERPEARDCRACFKNRFGLTIGTYV